MILTCPHCETQFSIDEALLKPKGRKVKCSSCEEVWFEKPVAKDDTAGSNDHTDHEDTMPDTHTEDDQNEGGHAEQEDTQDIPPPQERGGKPEEEEDESGTKLQTMAAHPKAALFGYIAASFIFLIILAVLIVFRADIMKAHPNTLSLYKPLGLAQHIDTDGLVFDNIKLRYDMHSTLHLDGNIVNLTEHKLPLPHVKATLLDKDDKEIDTTYIDLEKTDLDAESNMNVTYKFKHVDNAVENVKLNFTLNKEQPEDTSEEITDHDTAETPDDAHKTEAPESSAHH